MLSSNCPVTIHRVARSLQKADRSQRPVPRGTETRLTSNKEAPSSSTSTRRANPCHAARSSLLRPRSPRTLPPFPGPLMPSLHASPLFCFRPLGSLPLVSILNPSRCLPLPFQPTLVKSCLPQDHKILQLCSHHIAQLAQNITYDISPSSM